MEILVTGGSGFIGSHVVDKLIEHHDAVKVFDIKPPHRSDVPFFKGSITSFKNLQNAMKNMGYVFHIAALSNINTVVKQPLKAIDFNIMGTATVLEAARKADVKRILFASSYFVGSGKGHLYTTAKEVSELLCKDYYALYGLPYTILRYGTAYGPRSRGEDVISIAVEKAFTHQPFVIHGTGTQSRNFIYVEDLAWGNVAALQEAGKNKTFILEGNQQITINSVVETVRAILGELAVEYKEERYEDYTGTPPLQRNTTDEIGWKPTITFTEGVKKYIEWYRQTHPK